MGLSENYMLCHRGDPKLENLKQRGGGLWVADCRWHPCGALVAPLCCDIALFSLVGSLGK